MTPLVVVLGPTAAGKTRFALELARRVSIEVISADSRQVYRQMDIGTAKPTAADQALVRHHLIDIVDPDEPFHLGDYVRRARQAISDVQARGAVPLLVGGSGQYLWSIVEGWQVPAVEPDSELRFRLTERAQLEGPQALHQQLRRLDPGAASAIHPNNVRRVVRALELVTRTGIPASEQRVRRAPRSDVLLLGLRVERQEIYRRIDRRVDEMFEAGLIREVECLLRAGYEPSLPSMSGIGYTQGVQFLSGEIGLAEAIAGTKTATHRFARQQGAWFRGDDPRINWVADTDVAEAVRLIQATNPLLCSRVIGATS